MKSYHQIINQNIQFRYHFQNVVNQLQNITLNGSKTTNNVPQQQAALMKQWKRVVPKLHYVNCDLFLQPYMHSTLLNIMLKKFIVKW